MFETARVQAFHGSLISIKYVGLLKYTYLKFSYNAVVVIYNTLIEVYMYSN